MSEAEHRIVLPLLSKTEESSRLPLVVNVLAHYWGETIPITQHDPVGSNGPSMIDGIELAEAHGLSAFVYQSSIKDLKKRIDQNIPPIVILPGVSATLQHASIVSGYSSAERRIFLYVPEPETEGAVPESKFEEEWRQDSMTAIVIIPSEMAALISCDKPLFEKSNRLYLESERLWRRGMSSDAIARLDQATKVDPGNAQVWGMLGSIQNERGSDNSIAFYERAISINPRYFLAHRGLGNYYLKTKQYSKAVLSYSKAIEINPVRSPAVFKNRAIALMELSDNDGAKKDLQRYLELSPAALDSMAIRQAIAEL